jgi:hypothetical protein
VSEKLLIFQKTYDFILWFYPIINRIPKSHRLILGRQMEELAISLLILVIRANKTKDQDRLILQLKISDDLDCLRILVRLTKDLHFMSILQYQHTAERLNEIGKMLYGWTYANKNRK